MNKAISTSINYEVNFYLYGYSMGWIKTIQDIVLNYPNSRSEEAEAHSCEACMSARFISADKIRMEKLRSKINRLLNLAKKTYHEKSIYKQS